MSFDKFLDMEEIRHKEGEIKVRAVLEIRASFDQIHTQNSYNIINLLTNRQLISNKGSQNNQKSYQ